MIPSKKSLGLKIFAYVLSFAMVCTLLGGVNVVAFAADDSGDSLTDTVPVLRAYNPNNGEHLLTIDEAEYDANVARGYVGEGEAWMAPLESNSPVYRAYNPNSGEHLLLADKAEYDAAVAAGWEGEGPKMYSDDNKGVPIYRVFNPNTTDAGSHLCCGEEEAEGLVAIGWKWDNGGEPVIYGVEGEAPEVVVNLTDAKQLSANTIEVKFDQSATDLVTKEDIEVSKADGTRTIPVNSMTLSDDGMSAVLELVLALQDKTDYSVKLNESVSNFTASVGEVASVVLRTASAQQNVETPIEFALFDAAGVDVTSAINVDATCSVNVEGNVTSNTDKASKSTIIMDTVGDKATVTITYNDGDDDSKDVTTQGVITCIEPEAEVGIGVYADVEPDSTTYINQESRCAKFYWGPAVIETSAITVEEDESNNGIFFCAAKAMDPDGVIAYDSYTVTSSNDDVMSVTADVDSGKFAQMTVTGNTAGSATIVITATKNGMDTPYTIPVTVTKTGELSSINFTVTRSKLTNAIEKDYYGVASAYGVDSNNNIVDADVTFTIRDFDKKGGNNSDITDNYYDDDTHEGLIDKDDSGFRFVVSEDGGETAATNTGSAKYTAWNAKGGSRTIRATVSQGDIVKEKTASVDVQALPNNIWNNEANRGKNGVNLTYAIELGSSTISPGSETTARLVAYYGGKFVGYVRQTNQGVSIGTSANAKAVRGIARIYNRNKDGYVDFYAPPGAALNGMKITMINAGVSTASAITLDYNQKDEPIGITYTYGQEVAGNGSYDNDFADAAYKFYLAVIGSRDKELIKLAGMLNYPYTRVYTDFDGAESMEVVGSSYITGGSDDAYVSTVIVNPTTAIEDIKLGVKYANRYNTPVVPGIGYALLYDNNNNMQESEPMDILNDVGEVEIVAFAPDDDKSAMLVSGDTSYDKNFARPGSYTVEFRYTMGHDGDDNPGKEKKLSANLSVINSFTPMIPTVNVKDRNVDSLDEATIIENMSTMVDINNNTSSHESIKALGSFDKTGRWIPINLYGDSVNVRYALVDDVIKGITIHFYVPINKTFYLK